MITHEHVINFLRINNISRDSSDEVIREALIAARWDAADVAYALCALQGTITDEIDKPFVNLYSDRSMSANAISSLLHIDVKLNRELKQQSMPSPRSEAFETALQNTILVVVSLGIASGIGFVSMYYLGIGPFY